MARATWLAAVLRKAGLHVIEMDGWQTRETRPGFEPMAVVWHHTATPRSASDLAVRRLLRDGRSDLPGPLCQLGLERDGTFVVIAAGRCNHNGFGEWGNDAIGIEAYNDGIGEPWAPAQLEAYHVGTAALCRALGIGAERVKGHRETDPDRKIDPTGIDMVAVRARVAALLAPTNPPTMEADLLYKIVWIKSGTKPGASYRVLFAQGKDGRDFPVEAHDIADGDLEEWRKRLQEVPSSRPMPPSPFIRIIDGPYRNVGS